jgi:molecular chaperone GrpE
MNDQAKQTNGTSEPSVDAQDESKASSPAGVKEPAVTGDATQVAPEKEPPPKDPLKEAQEEVASLKDRLLRTAADFDNFRKRTRRDIEDAERRGKESLLRELLPVFDNLERASVSTKDATDVKAVAEGVTMVLRQFVDTLQRIGIQRIESMGKAFDPTVHEAIQQIESRDQAPGTVVAEVQPGYTLGEKLIRAAMVVVAKAAPAEKPVVESTEESPSNSPESSVKD